MEFESDSYSHVTFGLEGDTGGGFFRTDMGNNPNELNRPTNSSKGNNYTVSSTSLEVAHGKWQKESDEEATLIVVSFRFVPPKNRRFKYAQINWTFTSDDPAIDVGIAKIAPDAGWALDPLTLKLERTTGISSTIGVSQGPANFSFTPSITNKENKDLVYHTSVVGTTRYEGQKNTGRPNSVRWILKENEKHQQGICTMLQAAIILRRPIIKGAHPKPRKEQFFKSTTEFIVDRGHLNVSGLFSGIKDEIKDFASTKGPGDAPVNYHADESSENGDFTIDKTNLCAEDLEEIMYMSLSSSFDDLKKERQQRKQAKEEAGEKKKQEVKKMKKKREAEESRKEKAQGNEWRPHKQIEKNEEVSALKTNENDSQVNLIHAPAPAGTTTQRVEIPMWLYVALGALGMYAVQQMLKSLFNQG